MNVIRRPRKPLLDRKVVFLDVETTGLDYCEQELLEIAIIDDEEEWCVKCKPENIKNAEPQALVVNGYTKEKWKDARPFKEHASAVAQKLSDVVVVGHNINFDMQFVERAMRRAGFSTRDLTRVRIDTVTLAFEHLVTKGLKLLNLKAVARHLEIPFDEELAHGALYDTQICKQVYQNLMHNRQMGLFG